MLTGAKGCRDFVPPPDKASHKELEHLTKPKEVENPTMLLASGSLEAPILLYKLKDPSDAPVIFLIVYKKGKQWWVISPQQNKTCFFVHGLVKIITV